MITSTNPIEVEFEDIPILIFIPNRVEDASYQALYSGGFRRPWMYVTETYEDFYGRAHKSNYDRYLVYARRSGTKVQIYGYDSQSVVRTYTLIAITIHDESEL